MREILNFCLYKSRGGHVCYIILLRGKIETFKIDITNICSPNFGCCIRTFLSGYSCKDASFSGYISKNGENDYCTVIICNSCYRTCRTW